MDVSAISQLIGSLGFPIAMCIYMIYVNDRNNKRNNETTSKLTDIINNNTIALTKLTERIDILEEIKKESKDE